MRGVKKAWRESSASRAYWGAEEGLTKVRRTGRLLMCALEDKSLFPRVFSSANVFAPFFLAMAALLELGSGYDSDF
nr:hypothetical protein Itr_chr12CG21780 [Ipomoea trifida]GMD66650.1 hypothetical protein Iba_chr12cCG17040 [Ipomoea batatas]GMD68822.1 hypothetical protein Iba_chr12dCG12940 [Ipomoea batatas]